MKAFRWYGKAGKLELEDIPRPEVGDEDVLIEVKAAGVCGSDLHFVRGNVSAPPKLPVTIGHEYAGIVVEKGGSVEDLKEGDRVSVNYIVSCGDCVPCNRGWDNLCLNGGALAYTQDGGFAEYALVPARNAFQLPEQVPFDQGAIVSCAVTTPLHALRGPGRMKQGDTVAVYGLGGIGMHAVQWAVVLGAKQVIGVDTMDYKLEMAKEFGSDIVIDATQEDPVKVIQDVTGELGVDVVLDTVGMKQTILQMIRSVGRRGRAIWIGHDWYDEITFPMPEFKMILMGKEAIFTGSADHSREDHRMALQFASSGKYDLSRSITHRLPFEELNEAIAILDEKKDRPLRVVVTN